jgi:hypothetical protein
VELAEPTERVISRLLLKAYRRRLRASIGAFPSELAEGIRSAFQAIGADKAAVWISENRMRTLSTYHDWGGACHTSLRSALNQKMASLQAWH